jgi:hypothetical protein
MPSGPASVGTSEILSVYERDIGAFVSAEGTASRPAIPALTTTKEDRLEVLAGDEPRRLVFRHHGSVHFAALSVIVSSQLWLGGTGITSHVDWLLSKNAHPRLRSFAAEDLFLACARSALVFRALARQASPADRSVLVCNCRATRSHQSGTGMSNAFNVIDTRQ